MLHNFKDRKIKVAVKPYFEEDCKKIAAGQKPDRAWETDIYITRRCNLSCSYCYIREYFDRDYQFQDPDIKLIFSLLDKLAGKTYGLVILGGEPLIRKDFAEILKYARRVGIPTIRTSSNGVFIKQSMAAIKYLDRMNISLDATRNKEYPKVMEKMLADLVKVKNIMGRDLPEICISYTLAGDEEFKKDIAPIIDFAQGNGFKIKFIPCKYPNQHVNWGQFKKIIKKTVANYGEKILLNVPELSELITDNFLFKNCLQGIQFYIDFEGNFLYPCDEYSNHKVGKIYDYTLDELYKLGQEKFGIYPDPKRKACRQCKSYCHAENSYNYRHPQRQLDIFNS
jgi:MoaA/NifB/PqqE/SkfB family radical SAM enzyme